MKQIENVIVTVIFNQKQLDLELPAFIPVHDMKEKVGETFRVLYPRLFTEIRELVFVSNGKILADESCLASCGIWDGSTILCEYKTED